MVCVCVCEGVHYRTGYSRYLTPQSNTYVTLVTGEWGRMTSPPVISVYTQSTDRRGGGGLFI